MHHPGASSGVGGNANMRGRPSPPPTGDTAAASSTTAPHHQQQQRNAGTPSHAASAAAASSSSLPTLAGSAVAPSGRPMSPAPDLDEAWSALVAVLDSLDDSDSSAASSSSGESVGHSRAKLLLARLVVALSSAASPISSDGQRALVFCRSVCDEELANPHQVFIERHVTTITPFIITFLNMIAHPDAATNAQMWMVGEELVRCTTAFLQILGRKARDQTAIRCVARDLDELLRALLPHHVRFITSLRDGEVAFDAYYSPYHQASLAGAMTHPAGASGSFQPVELQVWKRLRQYSACRCCQRLAAEEEAAHPSTLPSTCTCSPSDTLTQCACERARILLSASTMPPRIAAHPFHSFFTQNLQLHSREIPLRITSTHQLLFYTERILQIYVGLLLQRDDTSSSNGGSATSEVVETDIPVKDLPQVVETLLAYGSLPAPSLRDLALQAMTGLCVQNRMPASVHHLLINFIHAALTSHGDRGARRVARMPERLSEEQLGEDDRLQAFVQAACRHIPLSDLHNYAPSLIQASLRCMEVAAHPAQVSTLIRVCSALLRQFPHTLPTLLTFHTAALHHHQRTSTVLSMATLQGLQQTLVSIAAEQLFPQIPISDVWGARFSPLRPLGARSRAAPPVVKAEKFNDMPSLERHHPPQSNRVVGVKHAHSAEDGLATPAKRTKTSHEGNGGGPEKDDSAMDIDDDGPTPRRTVDASPDDLQSTAILHPIYHDLLHQGLAETTATNFAHPRTKTPAEAILALIRLEHAAALICSQAQAHGVMDGESVASSPICLRLSLNLASWLQWLSELSTQQQRRHFSSESVEDAHSAFFSALPTLLVHMYEIVDLCLRHLPVEFVGQYRQSLQHITLWPLTSEALRNRMANGATAKGGAPALSAPLFPASCLAASMRLLCRLPVHELTDESRLMGASLASNEPIVQCMAIALLPAFTARLAPTDRRTHGKAFIKQLLQLVNSPKATTPPDARAVLASTANIAAAIAASIGPLTCVTTSPLPAIDFRSTAERPRRARHASFLPQRFSDATLVSPGGVETRTDPTPSPMLDLTPALDLHQLLDDFARPSSAKLDTPVEEQLTPTPDQPLQPHPIMVTQPPLLNAPLTAFLHATVDSVFCPHCDGPQRSLVTSSSSSVVSARQDLLPFCVLLRLEQPLAVRWHMARSLFRAIRHLPAEEFMFAQPSGAAPAAGLVPPSPPVNRTLQSPGQRGKAHAELPFSLSQMGSGKKARPAAMHSSESAAPAAPDGDTEMVDASPPSEPKGPIVHPIAMQLLLLLFDPNHVIRECFVDQMELLIDPSPTSIGDSNSGPFFALFAAAASAASGDLVQESVEQFIICLTHIQMRDHLFGAWHLKLRQAIEQAPHASAKQRVAGVEMDGRAVASSPSMPAFDPFAPNILLTTFAAIGQLSIFTPLGSPTQQLLLWPLVEAMGHAIEAGLKELQHLALSYFTRLAHTHRLTTTGFFFLHSTYLFERVFQCQLQQTSELMALLFHTLVLQDGVEVEDRRLRSVPLHRSAQLPRQSHRRLQVVDWQLRDLYREGVRMTVPSMILMHFNDFCSGPSSGVLLQLAKLAEFDDASLQTFLVSLLDSILSLVFRDPAHFTVGFIQTQLIPFFSVGLKSSVKQLLDFVVFVKSNVLFELLWRTADESQAKQAKQVMHWIIHGDHDKAKAPVQLSTRPTSGKMHGYLITAPTSNSPPALTAAAASQPFQLTAPPATDAQLSELYLPYFLGVFTKLHALLTTTYPPISLPRGSGVAEALPVRIPHAYQVHAVHALAALLQLTKERLKGFIPKILASMQLFTSSAFRLAESVDGGSVGSPGGSSPLAFHLLCLWEIFIETLIASNNIGEYLSTIVVTLVHVLSKLHDHSQHGEPAGEMTTGTIGLLFARADFHAYRSSLPVPRVPRQADKPNLFVAWISSLPEHMLEQALDPKTSRAQAQPAAPTLTPPSIRAHCIAHISLILNDLLLKQRPNRDLTPWLKTIPPLPQYSSLAQVRNLLQNEFQSGVDRRLKELQKTNTLELQPSTSRQQASAAAASAAAASAASSSRSGREKEDSTRSAESPTTVAFYQHLERLLTTISHESDQVRQFTLKHFRYLLRDPVHRACWEAYCTTEIGGLFTTHSSARVTQIMSALLQRCADTNAENRLLASECMGEIGAIDPGHLSGAISVKPPQFTAQHAAHHRTVHLAHYIIQHLLVRSLRSATETQSQDRALFSIQQLLKYCGIDRSVQEVAEKSLVTVADKTQLQARNQVEQDLARIIDARHASEYLPHSALPPAHQRAQVYQALQLWLDFPSDVRAIIAPCLTSAYLIQDPFLQPRVAHQSTVAAAAAGPAKSEDGMLMLSAGKKPTAVGSARKRKEATAADPSTKMEIDDGEKPRMKTRTTPDRKKAGASASSSTAMVVEDGLPTLTASTIRPLPLKALYTRKATMPNWLAQFTRYLIIYTALPAKEAPANVNPPSAVSETLVYQACIGVVQSDVSIALFVLPYLVDHALRYGSDALLEFIKREIMAVLHAQARSDAPASASSGSSGVTDASASSAHSSAQMCIQAVFELLDTLQQWHVDERRKIEAAKNQQQQQLAASAQGSNSSTGDARPQLPLHYGNAQSAPVAPGIPSAPFATTRTLDAYKQFLDSIPKKVLASAAFYCKAFTRSLKYMESHLREDKDLWKQQHEKMQAAAQAGKQAGRRGTMTSALAAASSTASLSTVVSAPASDGLLTEGAGAGFHASDLDLFQHMYASLEEPDGMRGLATLRQKQSVPSQIKDLESVGKWAEALTCYDNCLQHDATQMTYHVGMMECFRNLGQWQVGLKHAQALLLTQPTSGAQSRQAAVYVVQNAWRLRDWPTVDQLLCSKQQPDPMHFEVRLAALLLALSKGDMPLYEVELRRARKAVLSPLSAASWESYERAYPYLLQLQMIAEVDQMKHAMAEAQHRRLSFPASHSQLSGSWHGGSPTSASYSYSTPSASHSQSSPPSLKDALAHLSSTWSKRLGRATQTFRIREQILCLRRVLYSQFDLQQEGGMGWLQLAHQARKAQQFEVAQGALLHATQMAIPNTFIERARLMRARGQLHDALLYLEKEAPADTKELKAAAAAPQPVGLPLSQSAVVDSIRGAPPAVKASLSATVFLLLGKWIQESNAKESRDVINLYGRAIHIQPKWEKAHFLLGKYYDELLAAEFNRSRFGTLHTKQQQQQQQELDARGKSLPAGVSKAKASVHGASPDVVSKFVAAILKSYGTSLMCGHKYLFQSMPRLLTLWFEHSENYWDGVVVSLSQVGSARPPASGHHPKAAQPNTVPEKFSQCNEFLTELIRQLPAYQWLTAFPQIISRLTHKLPAVYASIKSIIQKVFLEYPQQAIWLLAPVTKSIDPARSARSKEIFGAVRKAIPPATNQLLDRAAFLFDQLIKICTHMPKSKRSDVLLISTMFRDMSSLPLIVPLQKQMTVSLPPLPTDHAAGLGASMETPLNGSMSYDNHYVALSKNYRAFPSHQVTIAGYGNEIEVLKSKEKPKKLTVLGSDGKSYAFLCKKEIKGDMRKNSRMMEFNTVVNRLLRESGDSRTRHLELRTFSVLPMTEECGLIEWVPNTTGFRHLVRQTHDEEGIVTCFVTIKNLYTESQQQVPNDVANEIKLYERLCEMFRPVFHKWFLTQFPEPYAWFQARLKYARSSAVWSMVGYVVGLGDRHGENILIDESTGDCVHVDFDCLFGKGLTLEKPERVPFRLTPNMVDALGICGVEGLFSTSAEVAMQVMRSNEQTMMSVLHTFIYDPLVEWKNSTNTAAGASSNAPTVFHPNAVKILDEIEMKLRGQVAKESLPLNVHGQVAQLIKEATSAANLAQMYIGWMAWL